MMFADESKIWTKVDKVDDNETLQTDLDKLVRWSEIWLLKLNVEKCKVNAHWSHSSNKVFHEY